MRLLTKTVPLSPRRSERALGTPLMNTSILNPFGSLSCGTGNLSAAIGKGGGLMPRSLVAASEVGWLGVGGKAWQRQPQKSSSRRGQLAHGSFIHALPRKALKAGEFAQISASACSRTFQNSRPGMDSAAWQGSTLPAGVTLSERRPQPPTPGLG